MKWIKSKFQGVRYREHPTRKHGVTPDKYFTIFYKLDGKMVQEALGWASATWEEVDAKGIVKKVNWTEKRAAAVLAELQSNQRLGEGPRTLKEKRAAQQKALAAQKAQSITVAKFWEQDYFIHLRNRVKASSWKKEQTHYQLRIAPLLGDKALKEVAVSDLELMVSQLRDHGRSPRTIQYAVGTFHRIWKHASKRGLVKPGNNPALEVQVEQVNNTRLRVLTPAELHGILDLLADADPHAHNLTMFCALTGCRFSEAARLRWEFVDLDHHTATFYETKNGETRQIELSHYVVEQLFALGPKVTGSLVFTKKDGSSYLEPPSAFKTAVEKLELNRDRSKRDLVTFHTLRHTAATFAARAGTPVKDMQQIFGWKTPSMVFRYVKGSKEVQRSAVQGLANALLENRTAKTVSFMDNDGKHTANGG